MLQVPTPRHSNFVTTTSPLIFSLRPLPSYEYGWQYLCCSWREWYGGRRYLRRSILLRRWWWYVGWWRSWSRTWRFYDPIPISSWSPSGGPHSKKFKHVRHLSKERENRIRRPFLLISPLPKFSLSVLFSRKCFYLLLLFISLPMNTTKIICWNYRGISMRDTSSRVFRLMRTHKLVVVCLVETRANSDRLDRFCRKMPKNWDWAAMLSNGFYGGIITFWHKSNGRVSPMVVSRRALHIIITNTSSNAFLISVI